MFRIRVPGVPWPFLRFAYGTMAPYQGFSTVNSFFRAEGELENGVFESIDLQSYLHLPQGEFIILFFRLKNHTSSSLQPYQYVAQRLFEEENKRGKKYRSARLLVEQWPMSVRGFWVNNISPLQNHEILGTYP